MSEFIPVEYYTLVFYNIQLVILLIVYFQAKKSNLEDASNLSAKRLIGHITFILLVFFIGLRPVSGKYFGDMARYALEFKSYGSGLSTNESSDWLFSYFIRLCSSIMSVEVFFILCAAIYSYPMLLISRKLFGQYWFYCFLIMTATFTFWGAATNGIRNGIATSMFLLVFCLKKEYLKYLVLLISVMIHQSLMLCVLAYFLTRYHTNTKQYMIFWVLMIPISLVLGGAFENLFMSWGFGQEDRLQGYFTELDEGIATSKPGFRWDFLLYSATGVLSGWYFIVKKGFDDYLYRHIFNIYLVTNAFWILVIRANFSNRFAYLSWFLLGIVIIYPLLKLKFFNNQHIVIVRILLIFFSFTYLLNVIVS